MTTDRKKSSEVTMGSEVHKGSQRIVTNPDSATRNRRRGRKSTSIQPPSADTTILECTNNTKNNESSLKISKRENEQVNHTNAVDKFDEEIHPTKNKKDAGLSQNIAESSTSAIHKDDEIVLNAETSKRNRGKKRKGRKQTSDIVESSVDESSKISVLDERDNSDVTEKKKRRCIGRKPVTDFVVGESYSGTVVYIKPFGLFLDIGCHSDAFCHVSRISDDYVESIDALYQEGDAVKARVVDVNRKLKRVTVSMQSEKRIEDEKSSMNTWKEILERRQSKQSTDKKISSSTDQAPSTHVVEEVSTKSKSLTEITTNSTKLESDMTPNEIKRARKVARRAERRKVQAST
jgi:predicted RNA-binding protein with RPS1 domain